MVATSKTDLVVTVTCGRCATQRNETADAIRSGSWMRGCPRCHPERALQGVTSHPQHNATAVERSIGAERQEAEAAL